MKDYRVSFFLETHEPKYKSEFLGSVVVDDAGTGRQLTIEAKAFRQAPPDCLRANKTVKEPVN